MKKFKLINNITGWVIFLISAYVYISTIEPTASFWDCGEFIAASFKQEIGHPPGAPLFLMLGRIFTLFAGKNLELVPVTINILSALASAFTILFLFWTITLLVKRIIIKSENDYNTANILKIVITGIVGALSFTFTDSFWFSAVEGEVYATSSLFTAIVFWAILKWEQEFEKPNSNRWILFIAYMIGLSIGVHLLNLLAIPAIVLVYYFKKNEFSYKKLFEALGVSALILIGILYIIIPFTIKIAAQFDLLFVNSFGLPVWSGFLFFIFALFSLLIYGILKTYFKEKYFLNITLLSILLILIGYSTYTMIVIRSLANPSMDQNDPENPFALLSYLNREQYGDRPLIYGPYFNARPIKVEKKSPVYSLIDGKYVITSYKLKYIYDKRFMTFFPRMWSNNEDEHIDAYIRWAKIKESDIYEPVRDESGNIKRKEDGTIMYDRNNPKNPPTFAQNLRFFFKYQLGHMYIRYFMWNFVGRQNDIQSHFKEEINKGNWISGIKFLDSIRLGNQDKLPYSITKNKGYNRYYFLPLILGLLGILVQWNKDRKGFWAIFMFFFMTGIAIILYLNQNPIQPRERDYSYAGSFYAFAIWIGIGVLLIIDTLSKYIKEIPACIVAFILTFFGVPYILAKENWDDHDRSGRYVARDCAYNFLESCNKNAILFTNGDNDTFPLWYAQEVENIRTDVRVVNLSYLGADWYINQMKRKVYKSDPLPISMTKDKFIQGKRDVVYLVPKFKEAIELKKAMEFLISDHPATKTLPEFDEKIDYLPNNKFLLKVEKDKVIKNGLVNPKDSLKIENEIKFEINRRYLLKNHIIVLDILSTNDWERPIGWAITVSPDNYLNLNEYLFNKGMVYELMPIKTNIESTYGRGIDVDRMYENLMFKFKYGNVKDKKVYCDENIRRILLNIRNNFAILSDVLYQMGKKDSAKNIILKSFEEIPDHALPYDFLAVPLAYNLYRIGDKDKANEIFETIFENACSELDYIESVPKNFYPFMSYEIKTNLYVLNQLNYIAEENKIENLKNKIKEKIDSYKNLIYYLEF